MRARKYVIASLFFANEYWPPVAVMEIQQEETEKTEKTGGGRQPRIARIRLRRCYGTTGDTDEEGN